MRGFFQGTIHYFSIASHKYSWSLPKEYFMLNALINNVYYINHYALILSGICSIWILFCFFNSIHNFEFYIFDLSQKFDQLVFDVIWFLSYTTFIFTILTIIITSFIIYVSNISFTDISRNRQHITKSLHGFLIFLLKIFITLLHLKTSID